ncbi:MAG: hypothetical protein FJ224_12250 [Lentisphaerae bacterium]|nr:hypothetical protein [Lentisphaerota bacterium]
MAHSTLHFAAGMALGTALSARPLVRAWRDGHPMAGPYARWFASSLLMGAFAVAPPLLRRLGAPESLLEGPAGNIFVLHPLINRIKPGGQTMGPLLLGAAFAFEYCVLLACLLRARKRRSEHPQGTKRA